MATAEQRRHHTARPSSHVHFGIIPSGQVLPHVPNLLMHTDMNMSSSRSHAILQLVVEQWPGGGNEGRLIRSKLNFVDLAGSERWNVKKRWPGGSIEGRLIRSKLNFVDLAGSERWNVKSEMKAGFIDLAGVVQRVAGVVQRVAGVVQRVAGVVQRVAEHVTDLTAINSSLSSLANMMAEHVSEVAAIHSSLSSLANVVDSLGGNCRTTIIATISPSVDAFDESCSTLKFADRISNLNNNPIVNTTRDMASVLVLKEKEIQRLRQMLSQVTANGTTVGLPPVRKRDPEVETDAVSGDSQWGHSGAAPGKGDPEAETDAVSLRSQSESLVPVTQMLQELDALRRAFETERTKREQLELKLNTRSGTGFRGSTADGSGAEYGSGGGGSAVDDTWQGSGGSETVRNQDRNHGDAGNGGGWDDKANQEAEDQIKVQNGIQNGPTYDYFKVDTPPATGGASPKGGPKPGPAPESHLGYSYADPEPSDPFWASKIGRNGQPPQDAESSTSTAVPQQPVMSWREKTGRTRIRGAPSNSRVVRRTKRGTNQPGDGLKGGDSAEGGLGQDGASKLESAIQALHAQVEELALLEAANTREQDLMVSTVIPSRGGSRDLRNQQLSPLRNQKPLPLLLSPSGQTPNHDELSQPTPKQRAGIIPSLVQYSEGTPGANSPTWRDSGGHVAEQQIGPSSPQAPPGPPPNSGGWGRSAIQSSLAQAGPGSGTGGQYKGQDRQYKGSGSGTDGQYKGQEDASGTGSRMSSPAGSGSKSRGSRSVTIKEQRDRDRGAGGETLDEAPPPNYEAPLSAPAPPPGGGSGGWGRSGLMGLGAAPSVPQPHQLQSAPAGYVCVSLDAPWFAATNSFNAPFLFHLKKNRKLVP
eukprot:gene23429-30712_t